MVSGICIAETTGECKSCGMFGILGDGLCQSCWDKGENLNKSIPLPTKAMQSNKKKRYNVIRKWNRKYGEYRICIACGDVYYVRPSYAQSSRPHKVCRRCGSKMQIPPKPIWIKGKRYSIYNRCPVCRKYLVVHVIRGETICGAK